MNSWEQYPWPTSLQLIGSKGLGGAEHWYQRFCDALAERGAPASMGVRQGWLDRVQLRGSGAWAAPAFSGPPNLEQIVT